LGVFIRDEGRGGGKRKSSLKKKPENSLGKEGKHSIIKRVAARKKRPRAVGIWGWPCHRTKSKNPRPALLNRKVR